MMVQDGSTTPCLHDPHPTYPSGAAQVGGGDLCPWAAALAVLEPVPPLRKQEDRSKGARQGRITKVLACLTARLLRSQLVLTAYERWAEIEAKSDQEWTPGEEYFVDEMAVYECKYGLLQGNTNSESTRTLKDVLDGLEKGTLPPPEPPSPPPPAAPVADKAVEAARQRVRWQREAEQRKRAVALAMQRSSLAPARPTTKVMEPHRGSIKRPLARACEGASVAALLQNAQMGACMDSAAETEVEALLGGAERPLGDSKRSRMQTAA